MASHGTEVGWLRVICAFPAIAGAWAPSRPELYDRAKSPTSWSVLAFGVFGVSLFAYVALRGRLPKGVAPDASRGPGSGSDA